MNEHERKAEYHRGYVDGTRALDADRAKVAMRLRALDLSKYSYAYPRMNAILCAIEGKGDVEANWTAIDAANVRDRIIKLMGGAYLSEIPGYRPTDVVDLPVEPIDSSIDRYHKELRRLLGEARSMAHDLRQSRKSFDRQRERNKRLEQENKMLRNMLNDAADEYATLTGVLSLNGITVRSVRH